MRSQQQEEERSKQSSVGLTKSKDIEPSMSDFSQSQVKQKKNIKNQQRSAKTHWV